MLICRGMKEMVGRYQGDIELEVQQRSVEFTALYGLDAETRYIFLFCVWSLMGRRAVLEKIPVLEGAVREEARKGMGVPLCMFFVLVKSD